MMAEADDILQEEEPSPQKRTGRKFVAWLIVVLILAAAAGIAYLLRDRIFDYVETNWFGDDEVVPVVEPEPLDPPVTEADVSRQLAALERRMARRFVERSMLDERLANLTSEDTPVEIVAVQSELTRDTLELQLLVALLHANTANDSMTTVDALSRALLTAKELEVEVHVFMAIERAVAVALDSTKPEQVDALRARVDQVANLVTQQILGSSKPTTFFAMNEAAENQSPAGTVFSGDLPESTEPQDTSGFWGALSEGLGSVYRVRRSDLSHPSQNASPHTRLAIQLLLLLERSRTALDRRDSDAYYAALDDAVKLFQGVRFDDQIDSTQINLVLLADEISTLREESQLEFASDAIREALATLYEPTLPPPTFEPAE